MARGAAPSAGAKWLEAWPTKDGLQLLAAGVAACGLGALIIWTPIVAFAGLAALSTFIIFVTRPVRGCYVVVLFLPLTIGLASGHGLPLRVSDALVLAALAAFMIWCSAQGDRRIWLNSTDLGYGLLILCGSFLPLLSALQRGTQLTSDDIRQLLGVVEFFLVYRLVAGCLTSQRQIRVALWLLAGGSVLISVIGLLQVAGAFHVTKFLLTFYPPTSDEQLLGHRAVSVLRVPFALAGYNTYIVSLIAMYLQTRSPHLSRRGRNVLTGVIVLDVVAALATLTFTSVICLLTAAFVIGRLTRRLGKALLLTSGMLLLALVALGPLVEERLTRQFVGTAARYASSSIIPETWPVRLSHWVNVFWPAIRPHLLLGVRPSIAADPTLAWSSTESLYLLLLYRGGLMLLAAFVVFAVLVLRKAFSLRHSADDMTRALAQGVIVIMIVNLVIDVLDAHFFMAGEPECIAMVLAMLTAAARHPDVTIRKPDFKVYRERVGAR